MLALLRKKLAEFDATDGGFRLILSRDQIVDMMTMFMATSSNEARTVDMIDRTIGKVVELGFLRRLPKQDDQLEVRRVLKAFVDGQWLSDFDARLAEYAAELEDQPVTALFPPTDLDDPDTDNTTGFRLQRLEVLNWGTFDRRAWRLDMNGHNGLLTGDIGSGKSTLVDAVTTLLLPAHRIAYNKAAGAQARERDLRSYVLGFYKSERNEATGSSRPVGLRGAGTYSVVLGHFRNAGFNADVTLAQVFWMKEGVGGQPERFYVTADAEMSIAQHFCDFGSELPTLRKRLRKGGAVVYDHFPEYSRDYRRKLAIASEQAMDLFHQTVSMKSVGNLNEFVREHMLEPFEAAAWVDKLVAHFEDLTRAHDAVVKARSQLAELEPLVDDCDTYDELQTLAW